MYVANVTDYDNMTDVYDDSLLQKNNCSDNEINIDIVIRTLLLTIPCGISFLCLLSLMVYTIIKTFFRYFIKLC